MYVLVVCTNAQYIRTFSTKKKKILQKYIIPVKVSWCYKKNIFCYSLSYIEQKTELSKKYKIFYSFIVCRVNFRISIYVCFFVFVKKYLHFLSINNFLLYYLPVLHNSIASAFPHFYILIETIHLPGVPYYHCYLSKINWLNHCTLSLKVMRMHLSLYNV